MKGLICYTPLEAKSVQEFVQGLQHYLCFAPPLSVPCPEFQQGKLGRLLVAASPTCMQLQLCTFIESGKIDWLQWTT